MTLPKRRPHPSPRVVTTPPSSGTGGGALEAEEREAGAVAVRRGRIMRVFLEGCKGDLRVVRRGWEGSCQKRQSQRVRMRQQIKRLKT